MDTISLKKLRPEDFDKVSGALKRYQEAKEHLEAAEQHLRELGVVIEGKKRGRKPGVASGQPYTGKKRGRKPKNAVTE